MALAVLLMSSAYETQAAINENATYSLEAPQNSDRKAAREYRKEQRRARSAEYRAKHGKSDYVRMMKENNKQRRKMDKAARKQNRGKWDTNELGNVYGVN